MHHRLHTVINLRGESYLAIRCRPAWRDAIDKHEIKGVHVRADGWGAEVAKTYQVRGIPSYYLVDSQGLIVDGENGKSR